MKNDSENLRIVIVDDEKHGRDIIKSLLNKHFPEAEICGEAANVASSIELIDKCNPDIVFLDIELTDGTGFDILESMEEIPFEIIFATAYNYYAIKAIRFAALDYLLKPVDEKELVAAMKKAIMKIGESLNKTDHINLLKEQIGKPAPDKIALPTDKGFTFIMISDIVRCQAESNYTRFVLTKGSPVLVSRTLKEYEDLLKEYDFFRVHNSHLVNMAHVRKYQKGKTPSIVMSNGDEVELSARKKNTFLQQFAGF